ncbi:MAG: hypothetical protein QOE28_539, partial [Solirubrobacteraceae bacterium]|nr:hypothetical protein [Solirubrobacteraceae bacterium]
VQPDGRASLRTRTGAAHPLRLTRGELMGLLDELRAARFSSLPANGGGTRPIPDAFSYRVSYGGHTVSADSQSIPRRLRPILGTLMKIAARAAAG